MKQLYFLHIPKTAGKYISHNIKKSLDKNNLSYYISTHFPNNDTFKYKVYTSAHAGTYPIIPGMDVAVILRDPVEARISYFNFIHDIYLKDRPEYQAIDSYCDRLKYYLFEDKNFELHNNYQSRFLCNSADSRSWNEILFNKNKDELMAPFEKGKCFTWFVENDNTSLSKALENINSFKIVNTLDSIEDFCNSISEWFYENYGFKIEFDHSNKVNESNTLFNGEYIKSKHLISCLSEKEIEKIKDNNIIDFDIYNYVKLKEKKNV